MKKILSKSMFLLGAMFLFGCEGKGLANPKGYVASAQLDLIIICTIAMLCVVIPVVVMALYYSYKYSDKRSNIDEIYDPSWNHSTKVELICWGAPIIIIAFLAVLAFISTHKLDPYRMIPSKNKPVQVQVIALNWKWLFIYPEYNIATVNELYAPIDSTISFSMTADAPMNALYIPQLGGMIYSMAGMNTKLHLIGNEVGVYDGLSASYSGAGFSDMKFKAHITSVDDFNAWVKSVKDSGNVLTKDKYEKLTKDSIANPIEKFSAVQGDIFKDVINKYMALPSGMQSTMSHMNMSGSNHHHMNNNVDKQ